MSLRIATNVPSLNAQRSLMNNQRIAEKAMAQVATGSRITKAADDAAGLGISENLKSDIASYKQANRNAQDGVSFIQVAEGALGEVNNIVVRFRELAVQSASDTISDQEREFVQKEVDQLKSEVDRIANSTKFGEKELLNGSGDVFDFQVGVDADPENNAITYDASQSDATLSALGLSSLDVSDKDGARSALADIDSAQNQINGYRATLGALQNRLNLTTAQIEGSIENLSAANSRIRDADVAESTASLTKSNILLNASTSVLAQSNANPQMALKLIG